MNENKEMDVSQLKEYLYHRADDYQRYFDSGQTIYAFKALDCSYVGCSRSFAEIVGKAEKHIVGDSDFNFTWAELAEVYRKFDRQVFTNQNITTLVPIIDKDGRSIISCTTKTPVFTQTKQICGLYKKGNIIEDAEVIQSLMFLRNFDSNIFQELKKNIGYQLVESYTFDKGYNNRDSIILFYHVRGLSAKRISIITGFSEQEISYFINMFNAKYGLKSFQDVLNFTKNNNIVPVVPKNIDCRQIFACFNV